MPVTTHEGSRRTDPPGVLPRNLNYIIIGAIAVIVLGASMFSGQKGRKVAETTAATGPSQGQLKNFTDMLEKRRREEEEMRKALDAKRLRDEQARLNEDAKVHSGPSAPDPIREQMRARAAAAPFASSIAVQVAEKEVKPPSADHSSQIALREETKPAVQAVEKTGVATQQPESGKLLPEREGSLFRVYEGTTVKARLKNRLDGSFTGPVICLVEEEVRSMDRSTVLIPRGSTLLGRATRVEAQNQSRLAVTFTRLLLPNGYSIELDSAPGLDKQGESGLKDKVNNHRLRTFELSGAIGLLGGLALYRGGGNPYFGGVANSTGNSATNALNRYLNAVPTITIREGHQVRVYLPKDLLLRAYRP